MRGGARSFDLKKNYCTNNNPVTPQKHHQNNEEARAQSRNYLGRSAALHCLVQSSILMKLNFILKGLSQSCFGPGCLYEFSRGDSIPKCDLV